MKKEELRVLAKPALGKKEGGRAIRRRAQKGGTSAALRRKEGGG